MDLNTEQKLLGEISYLNNKITGLTNKIFQQDMKILELQEEQDRLMKTMMEPVINRTEPGPVWFCSKCGTSIVDELKKNMEQDKS